MEQKEHIDTGAVSARVEMISSDRAQNGIVAFVIIISLGSSVILVNNMQYYNGSFTLASRMEVTLISTVISDFDPTNESIYPRLTFTLNFRTNSPTEGNVRLLYMDAAIWLNDDYLSLTSLSRYFSSEEDQLLTPTYDKNHTLSRVVQAENDRTAIIDANSTGNWDWFVRFRYNFITFDNPRSQTWRTIYYNWTGSTTIL